jgi:DNA repair photolyase
MIAPVLPGITDDVPHLTALVRAAKDAGARFAGSATLRMYGGVRRRFMPVVAAHFPELLAKYERAFDGHGDLAGRYVAAFKRRVTRIRREVGIPSSPTMGRAGGQADGRTEQEAMQQELALQSLSVEPSVRSPA